MHGVKRKTGAVVNTTPDSNKARKPGTRLAEAARAYPQAELPWDNAERTSNDPSLTVDVDGFEGPLDLLLYLIRRQNLDILDIPVAEITRQYIEYIEVMRDLRRDAPVPDDSVQLYFERYGHEFSEPARVRVAEILLDTKAEAEQLRRQATPANFADLARTYSQRPGAAATGGEMGFVSAEQLGVLAQPVMGAAPGTLLGPMEIEGHYVLLLVGERRDGRPMSFAEARPLIEERLRGQSMDRVLRDRIDRLRSGSEVVIDDALLSQMAIKKTHA